jgi:tetratricopeptide (TPR) repeat protein
MLEMTIKSTRILLAAALLSASATVAILSAPASAATLNEVVQRHLAAAQQAAGKNDFATAKTEIAAARAASGRTPYDDYMINRFAIPVDLNSQDMTGAAQAAMDAADSPAQDDKEKVGNLNNAVSLLLATKQFDKANKYAKLLDATHPTDPKVLANIGEALYLSNDFAGAKTWAEAQLAASKAANHPPERAVLQVLMSADVGLKDENGAEQVLEQTVAAYNDPADWAQLIDVAITSDGIRDVEAIWLGRLLFLVNAPVSKQDADMIGSIAGHLTFFGDAVNAKAKGGTIDPDPTPRADADKKTIQDQIAQENAQNGVYSAKLAEALYSYGMYPEAEAAAKIAMQKGGNPDATEAPMVLGQALAAQGKFADAKAAFAQVTGGGPATARIVRLWDYYVTFKANPPAAAPAQAAK